MVSISTDLVHVDRKRYKDSQLLVLSSFCHFTISILLNSVLSFSPKWEIKICLAYFVGLL